MLYSLKSYEDYIMSYKLAVIPKIKKSLEYASAYGSQHDCKHIHSCLERETYNIDIQYKIIYEERFFKLKDKFDGVLFLGLSSRSIDFISKEEGVDIYVWAFNQCVWQQNPDTYDNVSIIFEQSTKDAVFFPKESTDIHFLPLAFQANRFKAKYHKPICDLVFNGTLYRNRREGSKNHRVELLELLLKNDITIVNYNGRARKKDERELLLKLKKYKNFRVENTFGEVKHYHKGLYSLDLPFLDTETGEDIEEKYGMSWHDLENTIWLNHWDIFRSIGAKANIITFDAPEIRALGLNNNNVHFYKSTTEDLVSLSDEIMKIINKQMVKSIDGSVWHKNTYHNRWEFIIKKIRLKKGIPYRNETI